MKGAARLAGHGQGNVQQVVLYLPVAAGAWSHFPEGLKSRLRADPGCKRVFLWNLQQPLEELLHHLPPVSQGAGQRTHRVCLSHSRPSLPSPTEPPQGSSGVADSNFASSRMRI